MSTFFSKHQYLIIWVVALAFIGSLTILMFQLNGYTLPTISSLTQPTPAPAVPPTPSVALLIQKDGKKNNLLVRWQNLPANTTALNIFRAPKNNSSSWELWKTIKLTGDQLADGSALIDLGSSDQSNYIFHVEAVNNGGGGGGGNSSSTEILWISPPTEASTSTPPGGPPGGGGDLGGGGNSSSTNGGGDNSSSTEGGGNGGGTGGNSSSSNNSSTGATGDPYYNPQIQVTGYGTASGDFWVRHINQSIEIGWQNLPPNTDSIILFRAASQDGPWSQLLKQQNPGVTGSYSFQLVDGTVNDPYYYKMTAYAGTTVLGTYGPVYLPAQ